MGYPLRAALHYEVAGDLDPYDTDYVERMRRQHQDVEAYYAAASD